jgi:hypothetical protein
LNETHASSMVWTSSVPLFISCLYIFGRLERLGGVRFIFLNSF